MQEEEVLIMCKIGLMIELPARMHGGSRLPDVRHFFRPVIVSGRKHEPVIELLPDFCRESQEYTRRMRASDSVTFLLNVNSCGVSASAACLSCP